MTRFCLVFLLFSLVTLGSVLLNLNGCGAGSNAAGPKIQHVVIIFQENRSTDSLFHDTSLMSRGADIANSGLNSLGQTIPLGPVSLTAGYDLSHTHKSFVLMYDAGKRDGADLIPLQCPTGTTNCAAANSQFMYVNPSEVQPYFQLAEQYTFADRMFQTNQGPSFPAHQFIISGTSAPSASSDLFAAENLNLVSDHAGCIAAPNITLNLIDPSGNESSSSYPCYEHPTLTDLFAQCQGHQLEILRAVAWLHLDWS